MIKSYLLKPRFSSINIAQCKYFSSTKTLISETNNETWFINQFNNTYKLTIKTKVNGESVYNEKIIDDNAALQLIEKSKNKSVYKKIYSVDLPKINHRTRLEYYLGDLKGLVVLSVQFENEKDAENFTPPSYAIKDITDDDYYNFINLSKVTFEDIEKRENFERFYKKVQYQISK